MPTATKQGHKIFRNLTTVRNTRIPDPNPEVTTLIDIQEEVTYDMYLDFTLVAELAKKAAGEKGRRKVSGPVVIQVVKRRKLNE